MTRQSILDLARREIGTAEEPAGSNCVKYNTSYYGRAVSGEAYPWCCVFLWWLFQYAGEPELFYGGKKTASCGTLVSYAKSKNLFSSGDYQSGDLVFLRFSGKVIQHVGIVERVCEDGTLVTIEGNTSTKNDTNGGAVMRRNRAPAVVVGAYRPAYEEETMTQEQFNAMMENWLEQRAKKEPSNYSAEARSWAESEGIILGDSAGNKQYQSFCTREQMITFLNRFRKLPNQ